MIETQEPQTTTTIQEQFNLQDLEAAAQVIELATRRGAFAASEISAIGRIYDKLIAFIKLADKAAKPQEATINDTVEVKE